MSRCTVDDWASRLPDHKQEAVRRLLEGPYPDIPPDLVPRAVERGRRLVRRRVLHILALLVGLAALIALVVLAASALPPADATAPPGEPPPLDW